MEVMEMVDELILRYGTPVKLAKELGVSQPAVHTWLRGGNISDTSKAKIRALIKRGNNE